MPAESEPAAALLQRLPRDLDDLRLMALTSAVVSTTAVQPAKSGIFDP